MTIRAFAACSILTLATICALAQSAAPPPPPPPLSPPALSAPAASAPGTVARDAAATTNATPTNAAFEVADVHASTFLKDNWGAWPPKMQGGNLVGDRYIVRHATMTQLVAAAYDLDPDHVQGGPIWLDWDNFDIEAKAPPTTSKETIRQMLQSLLEQRFGLVVHTGTAPMPAYVLSAPNGKAKLKESDGTGDPSCKPEPMTAPPAPGTIPQIVVACHNETMEKFAVDVQMMAGGYLAKPVNDSTGLTGAYDFDLKWTPRVLLTRAGSDGISIFDAVDRELGLKLALENTPRPVLIVDSVNEAPTPNPPDLAKRMPPLPPVQFEVAVIKPSKPDERISSTIRGDEQDFRAITMKDHIRNVFDINYHDDESMVGAPKWLGDERFDILAKLPSELSRGDTSKAPQVLQEEMREMLRTLIEERCKMKFHWETQPLTAYRLVAVSPKLTPADPKARTRCDEGPGPDGKDPRFTNMVLNRLVTCQNITMAQFGILLQALANDYIFNPVVDDTGLKGSYNFTLSFSSNFIITSGLGGAPAADGAQAGEPSGAVSLIDAVKNQLGLKLEKEKRPLPALVIDHIEEPTAN